MALWYYLDKGKPTGPFSTEDIIQKIRQAAIGPLDLVYRDKGLKWEEVRTVVEFRNFVSDTKTETLDTTWVVLSKKADGAGHKQRGPFSTAVIKQMLERGELHRTDYIWREGLKEWYKIMSIPVFNNDAEVRSMPPTSKPPAPPKISGAKNTQSENAKSENTKTFKIEPPSMSDDLVQATMKIPFPQELSGQNNSDLTQFVVEHDRQESTLVQETTKTEGPTRIVRRGRAKKPSVLTRAQRLDFWDWFLDLPPVRKSAVVGGVFIFCFLFVLSIIYWSSKPEPENLKMATPDTRMLKPQAVSKSPTIAKGSNAFEEERATRRGDDKAASPAGATPAATAAASAAKSQVEAKRAPSFLRLRVVNAGQETAQVMVETDASSHYGVTLDIYSRPGQSLGRKSYQRSWVLKKAAERQVSLVNRGVPFGTYKLDARVEDKTAFGEVSFGTKTKGFEADLRLLRKQLVFDHNEERVQYVKVAGRIENQAWKLVQGVESSATKANWRSFYRNWRKDYDRIDSAYLKKISVKTRNNYVHGYSWTKLKELRAEFSKEAAKLNNALNKRETHDVKPAKELVLKIQKMKDEMLSVSLF